MRLGLMLQAKEQAESKLGAAARDNLDMTMESERARLAAESKNKKEEIGLTDRIAKAVHQNNAKFVKKFNKV